MPNIKEHDVSIILNDTRLNLVDSTVFLGINLDHKLQ